MVSFAVAVQPFPSSIVTVINPVDKLVTVSAEWLVFIFESPLLHVYLYGKVHDPAGTVAVAVPSAKPLHETSVLEEIETVNG